MTQLCLLEKKQPSQFTAQMFSEGSGWLSGNISDLHLGSAWFESCPAHRMFCLSILVPFVCLSRQVLVYNTKEGQDYLLSDQFHPNYLYI
jgi:hypothetical protein